MNKVRKAERNARRAVTGFVLWLVVISLVRVYGEVVAPFDLASMVAGLVLGATALLIGDYMWGKR